MKKLPPAGSLRELFHVALPLMISSGSVALMQALDRLFLTWYSEVALAAALPAGMLNWTIMSIALGTAGYVNAFVAQYEGSGQRKEIASAVWQGVYFSVLASIVLMGFIPLAPTIFAWAGHDPEVQRLEAEYFAVLFWAAGPMVLTAALSSFYSGRGETRLLMVVNILGAAINAFFDYVLIFGYWGFPEMGIRGAAVGTVIGSIVTAGILMAHMIWGKAGRSYQIWPPRRFDRERFSRLMRFGLPNGFNMFMDLACFTAFVQIVGRSGVTELAATNLAFNLNALAFVPLLGLGTAIVALVGQRIGDGQPELAARTTWYAFGVAGGYMSLFAAFYVFAPNLLLAAYASSDPEEFARLHRQVVVLLRFAAVFAMFDAMAVVFGSAIRGAGDTRFAMLFSTSCGILFMVIPSYIAFHFWGGGLLAAWTSCTVFIAVLGIGFFIRFQLGYWKQMKVIEKTEEPADLQTA